ncbi:MAG: hypothetical protein E5X63_35910 [Mesorhizobium sp.]|nr:MAG: hypothetical protein E5X63_35910 [Mesorhizobium sp.]
MGSAGSKEAPAITRFYGFLTTKPNTLVAPIHEKAMPMILATQEETETWLNRPWSEAKPLQGHGTGRRPS